MKLDKMQIEMCKAILSNNEQILGCQFGDDFCFTFDHISLFVLPQKDIIFDTNKIEKADIAINIIPNKNDEKLIDTHYRYASGKRLLHKYQSISGVLEVYVDGKYIKALEGMGNFNLFGYDSLKRILVKDEFDKVVGAISPYRSPEN